MPTRRCILRLRLNQTAVWHFLMHSVLLKKRMLTFLITCAIQTVMQKVSGTVQAIFIRTHTAIIGWRSSIFRMRLWAAFFIRRVRRDMKNKSARKCSAAANFRLRHFWNGGCRMMILRRQVQGMPFLNSANLNRKRRNSPGFLNSA